MVKSSVDSRTDWNMIALCRGQLGEPEAAEEAYRRALAIDPSFKVRASVCSFKERNLQEMNRTGDVEISRCAVCSAACVSCVEDDLY